MKKIFLIISIFTFLLLVSCKSDDSTIDDNSVTTKEWIPSTFNLKNSLVNLGTFSYPHAVGCDQDFIKVIANNSAIFFSHEQGTCEVTETEQSWNRVGNEISITILQNEISGTVILENNDQLVIKANAAQFSDAISQFYPEFSQYIPILATMNVEITLLKKQ